MRLTRIMPVIAVYALSAFSTIHAQVLEDQEISAIIYGLDNPDWTVRAKVLFDIKSDYISSDSVKVKLVNLLDKENEYLARDHQGSLEAWVEDYYVKLVELVAATKDDRAITPLIDVFNYVAIPWLDDSLAVYGEPAAIACLENLDDRYKGVMVAYALLAAVKKNKEDGDLLTENTLARIKGEMLERSASVETHSIRVVAVRILGQFDSPDIIARLQNLADNDPVHVKRTIPGRVTKEIDVYPIREEAQMQLEKLKRKKDESP